MLARFGLDAFTALQSWFGLAIAMLAAYLVGRRFWSRYAVVGVLATGIVIAAVAGKLAVGTVQWAVTTPVFTTPEFTWRATVSLALPLFIVTMASQNLPGVAAIRAVGYSLPSSKIIVGCKSGGRSVSAVALMEMAGYKDLLEQRAGFDGNGREPGWRQTGLPQSTTPEPGRAYHDLKD